MLLLLFLEGWGGEWVGGVGDWTEQEEEEARALRV